MPIIDIRNAAGVALALAAVCVAVPALAQQTQRAGQPLLGSSNEPVAIASDKLEVRERDSVAVFSGNVELVQGKLTLRTLQMVVHYASQPGAEGAAQGGALASGQTEIERIEAEGKVYIKSGEQVATGDKGQFDMKSDTLVLTGREVVLSEGTNVVKGCKLTMRMSSGESQVDGCGGSGGRVQMLLQPGSQNNR